MTVLQEICFNALINVRYKPLVMYVMQSLMVFAKVDVISLENYWADHWMFVETDAVNSKFDIQGMSNKNFLINTGSLLVNFDHAYLQFHFPSFAFNPYKQGNE